MPEYDTSASLPAPVAQAKIWAGDGDALVLVPMLLDSGSDVTIVPLAAARCVGADVRPYHVPLLAYDGDREAGPSIRGRLCPTAPRRGVG